MGRQLSATVTVVNDYGSFGPWPTWGSPAHYTSKLIPGSAGRRNDTQRKRESATEAGLPPVRCTAKKPRPSMPPCKIPAATETTKLDLVRSPDRAGLTCPASLKWLISADASRPAAHAGALAAAAPAASCRERPNACDSFQPGQACEYPRA